MKADGWEASRAALGLGAWRLLSHVVLHNGCIVVVLVMRPREGAVLLRIVLVLMNFMSTPLCIGVLVVLQQCNARSLATVACPIISGGATASSGGVGIGADTHVEYVLHVHHVHLRSCGVLGEETSIQIKVEPGLARWPRGARARSIRL